MFEDSQFSIIKSKNYYKFSIIESENHKIGKRVQAKEKGRAFRIMQPFSSAVYGAH